MASGNTEWIISAGYTAGYEEIFHSVQYDSTINKPAHGFWNIHFVWIISLPSCFACKAWQTDRCNGWTFCYLDRKLNPDTMSSSPISCFEWLWNFISMKQVWIQKSNTGNQQLEKRAASPLLITYTDLYTDIILNPAELRVILRTSTPDLSNRVSA